jgi:hypothetical protein
MKFRNPGNPGQKSARGKHGGDERRPSPEFREARFWLASKR